MSVQIEIGPEVLTFQHDDTMLRQLAAEWPDYEFEAVPLTARSWVIDVGAHRGGVAITLAKRWGCRVIACEPHPDNFAELVWAIEANGVADKVHPYAKAVTGKPRQVQIRNGSHSGEHGEYHDGPVVAEVASTTLPELLRWWRIPRVRLLKLDAEGAEHDILRHCALPFLRRFDYVRGEIHMNDKLLAEGASVEAVTSRFPEWRSHWMLTGPRAVG